jgi:hypothetical protein
MAIITDAGAALPAAATHARLWLLRQMREQEEEEEEEQGDTRGENDEVPTTRVHAVGLGRADFYDLLRRAATSHMRCSGVARRFKTYHVRDLVLECSGPAVTQRDGARPQHQQHQGHGHGRERLVRERLAAAPCLVPARVYGRPLLQCLVSRVTLPPPSFSCAAARHDVRWVQQLVFQAHHLVRVVFETCCTATAGEPVVYKAYVEAELDPRADRPTLAAAVHTAAISVGSHA